MSKLILSTILFFTIFNGYSSKILIEMNENQTNHLKSYGIAFWILENNRTVHWLLNYEGGSFLIDYHQDIENECKIRGVSYKVIANVQAEAILAEIANPEINQESVKLEKAPKIAVYTPEGKQPWDDAVTLVLTYAEIPFEKIYDSTIVTGGLKEYDWLHLHHEDFTGQYGKFYRSYKDFAWYKKQVSDAEAMAAKLGFGKVSDLKLSVALNIKEYVTNGGFLFTMCSGTDSYDIALATEKVDICESMFDGDPADPAANSKLDFNSTLAFKDFLLVMNPNQYEFSSIDGTEMHQKISQTQDYFTLFEFSAKWDIVPTMLNQNHESVIKGFMGQTTSFNKKYIKSDVIILGETKSISTCKYMHGTQGRGTWTFYGGHDPEDYRHYVNDPPTDLNLHPNSPGYRLILNNVLFPAAKKKHQKT